MYVVNAYESKDDLARVASSQDELTKDEEEEEDRGHWGNRAEFLLSCIGLSVGLGNVWRFPVLAFENGGAAFLIPYIILQLLIGKPMYFMELVMGQFSGLGPTAVWRMNPAAKGIGVAMIIISIIVAIYYNVIMAYTLYYFFASMQHDLPWTVCKPEWSARHCALLTDVPRCTPDSSHFTLNSTSNSTDICRCTGNINIDFDNSSSCLDGMVNETLTYNNLTEIAANCTGLQVCTPNINTPAHFYFYEEVIQRSSGLTEMGDPIWYLALCLLLSWSIVVLCLIKGVKSSGKVVYFTATFPYVILIILLVGGAQQPGSKQGVLYFLVPKWEKLLNIDVWQAAAGQMFFSLSVSFGGIIMFGSYNKVKHNVYIDALIISSMDVITSFIAGLVIFTTLGAMSLESGLPIEEVAKKGYGLAFVAYPEALSRLPIPHLWSILFFFMLFTLGLDSEFALLETILTCIADEIPKLRSHKWISCVVSGAICYLIALPIVTPGGDWVLILMDSYGASFSVLCVAFCECVAVHWVYRVDRFMADVKYCLGYRPHPHWYWMFCWTASAPLLIGAIFVLSIIDYSPPQYSPGVPYEDWAQYIGWALAALVLIPIPLGFIVAVCRQPGSLCQKLRLANSPTAEWGPQPHADNTWVSHHKIDTEVATSADPYVAYARDSSTTQVYDNPSFEYTNSRF